LETDNGNVICTGCTELNCERCDTDPNDCQNCTTGYILDNSGANPTCVSSGGGSGFGGGGSAGGGSAGGGSVGGGSGTTTSTTTTPGISTSTTTAPMQTEIRVSNEPATVAEPQPQEQAICYDARNILTHIVTDPEEGGTGFTLSFWMRNWKPSSSIFSNNYDAWIWSWTRLKKDHNTSPKPIPERESMFFGLMAKNPTASGSSSSGGRFQFFGGNTESEYIKSGRKLPYEWPAGEQNGHYVSVSVDHPSGSSSASVSTTSPENAFQTSIHSLSDDGMWHHLAYTLEPYELTDMTTYPGLAKFYIDGVEVYKEDMFYDALKNIVHPPVGTGLMYSSWDDPSDYESYFCMGTEYLCENDEGAGMLDPVSNSGSVSNNQCVDGNTIMRTPNNGTGGTNEFEWQHLYLGIGVKTLAEIQQEARTNFPVTKKSFMDEIGDWAKIYIFEVLSWFCARPLSVGTYKLGGYKIVPGSTDANQATIPATKWINVISMSGAIEKYNPNQGSSSNSDYFYGDGSDGAWVICNVDEGYLKMNVTRIDLCWDNGGSWKIYEKVVTQYGHDGIGSSWSRVSSGCRPFCNVPSDVAGAVSTHLHYDWRGVTSALGGSIPKPFQIWYDSWDSSTYQPGPLYATEVLAVVDGYTDQWVHLGCKQGYWEDLSKGGIVIGQCSAPGGIAILNSTNNSGICQAQPSPFEFDNEGTVGGASPQKAACFDVKSVLTDENLYGQGTVGGGTGRGFSVMFWFRNFDAHSINAGSSTGGTDGSVWLWSWSRESANSYANQAITFGMLGHGKEGRLVFIGEEKKANGGQMNNPFWGDTSLKGPIPVGYGRNAPVSTAQWSTHFVEEPHNAARRQWLFLNPEERINHCVNETSTCSEATYLTDRKWHHLAFVYEADVDYAGAEPEEVRMYLDGVHLDASNTEGRTRGVQAEDGADTSDVLEFDVMKTLIQGNRAAKPSWTVDKSHICIGTEKLCEDGVSDMAHVGTGVCVENLNLHTPKDSFMDVVHLSWQKLRVYPYALNSDEINTVAKATVPKITGTPKLDDIGHWALESMFTEARCASPGTAVPTGYKWINYTDPGSAAVKGWLHFNALDAWNKAAHVGPWHMTNYLECDAGHRLVGEILTKPCDTENSAFVIDEQDGGAGSARTGGCVPFCNDPTWIPSMSWKLEEGHENQRPLQANWDGFATVTGITCWKEGQYLNPDIMGIETAACPTPGGAFSIASINYCIDFCKPPSSNPAHVAGINFTHVAGVGGLYPKVPRDPWDPNTSVQSRSQLECNPGYRIRGNLATWNQRLQTSQCAVAGGEYGIIGRCDPYCVKPAFVPVKFDLSNVHPSELQPWQLSPNNDTYIVRAGITCRIGYAAKFSNMTANPILILPCENPGGEWSFLDENTDPVASNLPGNVLPSNMNTCNAICTAPRNVGSPIGSDQRPNTPIWKRITQLDGKTTEHAINEHGEKMCACQTHNPPSVLCAGGVEWSPAPSIASATLQECQNHCASRQATLGMACRVFEWDPTTGQCWARSKFCEAAIIDDESVLVDPSLIGLLPASSSTTQIWVQNGTTTVTGFEVDHSIYDFTSATPVLPNFDNWDSKTTISGIRCRSGYRTVRPDGIIPTKVCAQVGLGYGLVDKGCYGYCATPGTTTASDAVYRQYLRNAYNFSVLLSPSEHHGGSSIADFIGTIVNDTQGYYRNGRNHIYPEKNDTEWYNSNTANITCKSGYQTTVEYSDTSYAVTKDSPSFKPCTTRGKEYDFLTECKPYCRKPDMQPVGYSNYLESARDVAWMDLASWNQMSTATPAQLLIDLEYIKCDLGWNKTQPAVFTEPCESPGGEFVPISGCAEIKCKVPTSNERYDMSGFSGIEFVPKRFWLTLGSHNRSLHGNITCGMGYKPRRISDHTNIGDNSYEARAIVETTMCDSDGTEFSLTHGPDGGIGTAHRWCDPVCVHPLDDYSGVGSSRTSQQAENVGHIFSNATFRFCDTSLPGNKCTSEPEKTRKKVYKRFMNPITGLPFEWFWQNEWHESFTVAGISCDTGYRNMGGDGAGIRTRSCTTPGGEYTMIHGCKAYCSLPLPSESIGYVVINAVPNEYVLRENWTKETSVTGIECDTENGYIGYRYSEDMVSNLNPQIVTAACATAGGTWNIVAGCIPYCIAPNATISLATGYIVGGDTGTTLEKPIMNGAIKVVDVGTAVLTADSTLPRKTEYPDHIWDELESVTNIECAANYQKKSEITTKSCSTPGTAYEISSGCEPPTTYCNEPTGSKATGYSFDDAVPRGHELTTVDTRPLFSLWTGPAWNSKSDGVIFGGIKGIKCTSGYALFNETSVKNWRCEVAGGEYNVGGCEPYCRIPAVVPGYDFHNLQSRIGPGWFAMWSWRSVVEQENSAILSPESSLGSTHSVDSNNTDIMTASNTTRTSRRNLQNDDGRTVGDRGGDRGGHRDNRGGGNDRDRYGGRQLLDSAGASTELWQTTFTGNHVTARNTSCAMNFTLGTEATSKIEKVKNAAVVQTRVCTSPGSEFEMRGCVVQLCEPPRETKGYIFEKAGGNMERANFRAEGVVCDTAGGWEGNFEKYPEKPMEQVSYSVCDSSNSVLLNSGNLESNYFYKVSGCREKIFKPFALNNTNKILFPDDGEATIQSLKLKVGQIIVPSGTFQLPVAFTSDEVHPEISNNPLVITSIFEADYHDKAFLKENRPGIEVAFLNVNGNEKLFVFTEDFDVESDNLILDSGITQLRNEVTLSQLAKDKVLFADATVLDSFKPGQVVLLGESYNKLTQNTTVLQYGNTNPGSGTGLDRALHTVNSHYNLIVKGLDTVTKAVSFNRDVQELHAEQVRSQSSMDRVALTLLPSVTEITQFEIVGASPVDATSKRILEPLENQRTKIRLLDADVPKIYQLYPGQSLSTDSPILGGVRIMQVDRVLKILTLNVKVDDDTVRYLSTGSVKLTASPNTLLNFQIQSTSSLESVTLVDEMAGKLVSLLTVGQEIVGIPAAANPNANVRIKLIAGDAGNTKERTIVLNDKLMGEPLSKFNVDFVPSLFLTSARIITDEKVIDDFRARHAVKEEFRVGMLLEIQEGFANQFGFEIGEGATSTDGTANDDKQRSSMIKVGQRVNIERVFSSGEFTKLEGRSARIIRIDLSKSLIEIDTSAPVGSVGQSATALIKVVPVYFATHVSLQPPVGRKLTSENKFVLKVLDKLSTHLATVGDVIYASKVVDKPVTGQAKHDYLGPPKILSIDHEGGTITVDKMHDDEVNAGSGLKIVCGPSMEIQYQSSEMIVESSNAQEMIFAPKNTVNTGGFFHTGLHMLHHGQLATVRDARSNMQQVVIAGVDLEAGSAILRKLGKPVTTDKLGDSAKAATGTSSIHFYPGFSTSVRIQTTVAENTGTISIYKDAGMELIRALHHVSGLFVVDLNQDQEIMQRKLTSVKIQSWNAVLNMAELKIETDPVDLRTTTDVSMELTSANDGKPFPVFDAAGYKVVSFSWSEAPPMQTQGVCADTYTLNDAEDSVCSEFVSVALPSLFCESILESLSGFDREQVAAGVNSRSRNLQQETVTCSNQNPVGLKFVTVNDRKPEGFDTPIESATTATTTTSSGKEGEVGKGDASSNENENAPLTTSNNNIDSATATARTQNTNTEALTRELQAENKKEVPAGLFEKTLVVEFQVDTGRILKILEAQNTGDESTPSISSLSPVPSDAVITHLQEDFVKRFENLINSENWMTNYNSTLVSVAEALLNGATAPEIDAESSENKKEIARPIYIDVKVTMTKALTNTARSLSATFEKTKELAMSRKLTSKNPKVLTGTCEIYLFESPPVVAPPPVQQRSQQSKSIIPGVVPEMREFTEEEEEEIDEATTTSGVASAVASGAVAGVAASGGGAAVNAGLLFLFDVLRALNTKLSVMFAKKTVAAATKKVEDESSSEDEEEAKRKYLEELENQSGASLGDIDIDDNMVADSPTTGARGSTDSGVGGGVARATAASDGRSTTRKTRKTTRLGGGSTGRKTIRATNVLDAGKVMVGSHGLSSLGSFDVPTSRDYYAEYDKPFVKRHLPLFIHMGILCFIIGSFFIYALFLDRPEGTLLGIFVRAFPKLLLLFCIVMTCVGILLLLFSKFCLLHKNSPVKRPLERARRFVLIEHPTILVVFLFLMILGVVLYLILGMDAESRKSSLFGASIFISIGCNITLTIFLKFLYDVFMVFTKETQRVEDLKHRWSISAMRQEGDGENDGVLPQIVLPEEVQSPYDDTGIEDQIQVRNSVFGRRSIFNYVFHPSQKSSRNEDGEGGQIRSANLTEEAAEAAMTASRTPGSGDKKARGGRSSLLLDPGNLLAPPDGGGGAGRKARPSRFRGGMHMNKEEVQETVNSVQVPSGERETDDEDKSGKTTPITPSSTLPSKRRLPTRVGGVEGVRRSVGKFDTFTHAPSVSFVKQPSGVLGVSKSLKVSQQQNTEASSVAVRDVSKFTNISLNYNTSMRAGTGTAAMMSVGPAAKSQSGWANRQKATTAPLSQQSGRRDSRRSSTSTEPEKSPSASPMSPERDVSIAIRRQSSDLAGGAEQHMTRAGGADPDGGIKLPAASTAVEAQPVRAGVGRMRRSVAAHAAAGDAAKVIARPTKPNPRDHDPSGQQQVAQGQQQQQSPQREKGGRTFGALAATLRDGGKPGGKGGNRTPSKFTGE